MNLKSEKLLTFETGGSISQKIRRRISTKKCHISPNEIKSSKCSTTSSNSSFALTGVSFKKIGLA